MPIIGILPAVAAIGAVTKHTKSRLSQHQDSLKKSKKNGGRNLPKRKGGRYKGLI